MNDELETTALEQSSEITAEQTPEVAAETMVEQVAEPESEAEQAIVQQTFKTKDEVVARVQEIAQSDEVGDKTELNLLKQLFYKFHNAEVEEAFRAFVEAGGEEDKFMPEIDPAEPLFREAMQTIRERRAAIQEAQEKQKQDNLQRKLEILERIQQLASTPEEANQNFDEFKALQNEWKEIKSVPAERATELWKNYQLYVEQFYDLLKLNSEAREYDFKKNLTAKERLIELAEKLVDEEDIIAAFNKLQALHAEYKEIGPVAKELREDVWNRFKAASTVINKRHQEHFEAIKAREDECLQQKTALCEQAESIQTDDITTFAAWEEKTKEVIELQAQWKEIGFAGHKQNNIIFDRFRSACDRFFSAKAEYFRNIKDEQNGNLEAKRKLAEEAEALKDSTEWSKTAKKLIELQKRWKEVGPVPRKYSEQLWKRFTEACDHFFEAKNAAGADQRAEETANMEAKKAIIEQLKELATDAANATIDKVKELQAQWNEIGHVPFRDKDKLYKEYRAVADELYKQFGASQARRRLEGFQKSVRQAVAKGESTLGRERERLMRIFEARKAEVQTYENNLNFLNATSKSGNSLVAEMNHKVEKLREELDLLSQKIKAVEAEMRAPKASPEAPSAPATPAAPEAPSAPTTADEAAPADN